MFNHSFYILKILLLGFFLKIPMVLSAYIVVPITILLISPKAERLPRFLEWYDIGDPVDRFYGLIGDKGNQLLNITRGIPINSRRAKILWLLRNPVNYFQYYVLGVHNYVFKYRVKINEFLKPDLDGQEVGDYTSGGYRYRSIYVNSKEFREYYLVKPYYKLNPKRCFRLRLGYKLDYTTLRTRSRIQFAFSFNPWKQYRGGIKI